MVSALRSRRSAIAFDLGAAGLRACQLQWHRGQLRLCDSLHFDRPPAAEPDAPAAPDVDPAQLERLIGQGTFGGRDVALILSPPEVQFFPMHLPPQALTQPPNRVQQAIKWEVAQESRTSGDKLEVRYWTVAAGRGQQANVMAVVMPSELAQQWCHLLAQHRLTLRRIDVSPCALVRLASCAWTPAEKDLWGVLDLGLRHAVLTVVIGMVPTYIRTLSASAHDWTQQVARAFEVSYPVAERLKREHGELLPPRERRAAAPETSFLNSGDLRSALAAVLREPLQALNREVGRCFSYVMQNFPDLSINRLYLTGGGAHFQGLPAALEAFLGVPTLLLARTNGDEPWERALPGIRFEPRAAAALGGALLDAEVS